MHWMKMDWLRGCECRNLCKNQCWTVMKTKFLSIGICQPSRTEKFAAIQFHARKRATLTSLYNGWLHIPSRVAPVNGPRLEKTREGKSDNWSVISNAADSVRDQKSILLYEYDSLFFSCGALLCLWKLDQPVAINCWFSFSMETIVSWLLWYILSYSTPNSSFFSPIYQCRIVSIFFAFSVD